MDKKIIKGLIDEKLEVIQEQFSIIKEYDGKIPVIEIDLLMASIRDMYELVLNLQFENTGGVMLKPVSQHEAPKASPPSPIPPVIVHNLKEEIPAPVEKPVEQPVKETVPVEEPVSSSRISSSFISIEPITEEPPVVVTLPEEKQEPVVPEPPFRPYEPPAPEPPAPQAPEPPVPPAPEPPVPPAPEPVAPIPDLDQPHERYQRLSFDLFSEGGGNTLADRYSEKQEKRIADKMQESKVEDLRAAIGINDKFLYINELFEGNMRIYDEAVQKLNASTTMAQADLLLLDLKIVYNWDSESPTVKKFVELVRRKF